MSNLERVLDNDKKYEDFAEKNSNSYEEIERALEVVKTFIIRKKLILYGGMAIDISLKLSKHKGIYKDDAIPDYDFFSPDFYNDSNELADILHKKGFQNVSAINAMHISTRRVRVNFIVVADIGYMPPSIFKSIPTLTYKGLRVVHPDFQRMDMHRAMSTPFEKPPLEVILHRGYKDQKRFTMLAEQYPIKTKPIKTGGTLKWSIPLKHLKKNVIGGVQAYCIISHVAHELFNKGSRLGKTMELPTDLKKQLEALPRGNFTIDGANFVCELNVDAPQLNLMNIITDDIKALEKAVGGNAVYFNKYIDDLRPVTALKDNYELFDNYPRLLPTFNLKSVMKLMEMPNANSADGVRMCASQYIMMYFLQKYFGGGFVKNELDKPKQDIFLGMYNAISDLIGIMAQVFKKLNAGKNPEILFNELPFFLSTNMYGSANLSPDYIVLVKEQNYFINYTPMDQREVTRPPFGYYPATSDKSQMKFNITDSKYFLFDGKGAAPP